MPQLHQESDLLADHISDHVLVARASSGDAIAFETIVRRHNQALFRAAHSIVADFAIAQDILQEAYIKAFTHLDSFQQKSSLKTWLTRIVINTALNVKKSRERVKTSSHDTVVDLNQYSEVNMSLKNDNGMQQKPDQLAEQEQIKQLLQDEIYQLSDKYRTVFILREVEQYSVAETAESLNISQDSVKTRTLRAKSMLRDKLSRKLEPFMQELFQFAGKNCDLITQKVLTELHQSGYLNSPK